MASIQISLTTGYSTDGPGGYKTYGIPSVNPCYVSPGDSIEFISDAHMNTMHIKGPNSLSRDFPINIPPQERKSITINSNVPNGNYNYRISWTGPPETSDDSAPDLGDPPPPQMIVD